MKQPKFNDNRPNRDNLIAYLAQRDRATTVASTDRKATPASSRKPTGDAPACAALL